jgi:SAM-dependent methyltransferase
MLLTHPLLTSIPAGGRHWFEAQRRLIGSKPLVRECYDLWYTLLAADVKSVAASGEVLELGSGAGYVKEFLPEVITSDVTPGAADLVVDARHLPFRDEGVRALLLTHVFHHIPDVRAFLREADRVLAPGGVITMVECCNTPLSRLFFGRLHPEPFRPDAATWDFPEGSNLYDSNQALSWIVFERDRAVLESEFPMFTIERMRYLPWLGYLLSGGVNLRSAFPRFATGTVRRLDRLSRRIDELGAIHWHITVRKVVRRDG